MSRPRLISSLLLAIVVIVLPGVPVSAAASAPTVTWSESIAQGLAATAVDDAGNVYSTGFRVPKGSYEPFMVLYKFDPDGNLLWKDSYKPRGGIARGVDLALGPGDDVFLAGFVASNHLEGGGWFLRRYTSDGSLTWKRETPGWRKGTAVGIDSIAVADGMLVVAGNDFSCCGDVANDGWVRAYDLDGKRLWTSPFEASSPTGTNDGTGGIAIGRSGGIYAAGWIATGPEPSDTERADHEIMVQRLHASGGVVWTRVLVHRGGKNRDAATGISVRGSQVMVAAESGGSWTRSKPAHAWLARLATDGSLMWRRIWGTERDRAAQPTAVSVGPSGLVLVVGTQRDPSARGTDAFVRAYSSSGGLRWRSALEEHQPFMAGTDVAAVAGGAALTGSTSDEVGTGWLWRLED